MLLALALLIYALKVGPLSSSAPDSSLYLRENSPYLLNLHVYLGSLAFIFFSIHLYPNRINRHCTLGLFSGFCRVLGLSGMFYNFLRRNRQSYGMMEINNLIEKTVVLS